MVNNSYTNELLGVGLSWNQSNNTSKNNGNLWSATCNNGIPGYTSFLTFLTCYLTPDHLGTPRMVTDQSGNVMARHDYLPFGEEVSANTFGRNSQFGAGNDSVRQKFTGKERDAESGLDYFGARYYGSALGRFTSPDGLILKKDWLYDPQRLNHYAYVRDNPLSFTDPNGEDLVVYTLLASNLTDEQRKYLQANMKSIQGAIAAKFKAAGVDKVEFRDGRSLSKKQIGQILQNGSNTDTTGIGLLNFTNKSYGGFTGDSGTLGITGADTRSAVFLGRIGGGLDLEKPDDVDKMNFRTGEVGAHELGHGQRFESDGETLNFVKGLFGGGNLMGEGQGIPTRPKSFDPSQEKTQRAIREINKIGDNTPKP